MGAPLSTTYSEEDRQRIISHVLAELSGGRAVSRILREDEGMPNKSTFWKWHFDDPDLQEKVARARENGVESVMDETIEIADDATNDWRKRNHGDDDDEDVLNHEHVSRSKLRIETRHKYAQMIAPRKYGQKLDLTSGGEKIKPPSSTLAIQAAALLNNVAARLKIEGGEDGGE